MNVHEHNVHERSWTVHERFARAAHYDLEVQLKYGSSVQLIMT
jgi:hypothetical protein